MAKTKNNYLTKGFLGKVGNQFFFRKVRNKTTNN